MSENLQISGEDAFTAQVPLLYSKLSDAAFLLGCLEEHLGEVIEATRDRAIWTMRPPMPMLPGMLEMKMEFLRRVEDSLTHVRIHGSGFGGAGVVETVNEIVSTDEGSIVRWTASVVEVSGMLKMVPAMMLEPGIRQAVTTSWVTVRQKLTEPLDT